MEPTHPDDDALIAALRAALSANRVLASPFEKVLYAKDASAIAGSEPGVICLPTSATEVQACVRIANAHGRPITPRGSGTGLAGGAVPLERPVVIVTTRGSEVDRRRGMEAGADGYVTKGDLVRQDLVDVVARLLA